MNGKDVSLANCVFVCVYQVESLYRRVSLDSGKMTQLMILGFQEREARLGLRACQGNVEEAAIYISNQRQVTHKCTHLCRRVRLRSEGEMSCFCVLFANQEQIEQRKRERRKRSRRLEVISILTKLGYSRREATRAAHLAHGDVDKAYGVCQTQSDN